MVMMDAPPAQSGMVPGSAVLAVRLSIQRVSGSSFFVGVGLAEPDHLTPCLRSPFFFSVEWATLSPRCSSRLLKRCWDLRDFPHSDPLRRLRFMALFCPGISWPGSLFQSPFLSVEWATLSSPSSNRQLKQCLDRCILYGEQLRQPKQPCW